MIDYLHTNRGYSRRLSAKIADTVLKCGGTSTFIDALEKALNKGMKKDKFIVRV